MVLVWLNYFHIQFSKNCWTNEVWLVCIIRREASSNFVLNLSRWTSILGALCGDGCVFCSCSVSRAPRSLLESQHLPGPEEGHVSMGKTAMDFLPIRNFSEPRGDPASRARCCEPLGTEHRSFSHVPVLTSSRGHHPSEIVCVYEDTDTPFFL